MNRTQMIIEGIGYFGSFLVVVSMLMTSVKKLRIINTTGSVIFMGYALLIQSYPTAFMNLCLVLINLYQLVQLGKKERHFQLLKVQAGEGLVAYLLEYYREDILKFFPALAVDLTEDCDQAYVVTCDTLPVGLFLGNQTAEGEIRILIDYATPAYRDTSVGDFLYRHLPDYNIQRIIFSSQSVGHEAYMEEMGFVKTEEGFVKEL